MGAYEVPVIWYVDIGAGGDGKSWGNAYDDLQKALDNSDIDDGNEIWVADGTYEPDGSDRTVSFELIEDVAVYGGFAGGESSLNGRDWVSNETILSGDIDAGGSDDSYNVVTGADGAVLDGFTITGGRANGDGSEREGGGIHCPNSSPIISNCIITGNIGLNGGGIYSGGVGAAPVIINCTIIGNSGSGIYNGGSSPKIINCAIADNNGLLGGGMENLEGEPTVTNCVFSGNFAWGYGGGMHNYGSYPTLTNCTFSDNDADLQGGGMYNCECQPVVTNCIFWDNNSVGDGNEIYNNDSEPFFGYCDIKDSGGSGDWDASLGIDLGGNIDADPCFVDASDPNGPDGIFRTFDDGLRLTIDSNCIDAADGDAAPLAGGILVCGYADIKDIDNTGRGEPNCADIGAYEYFPKLVHFTGLFMVDEYWPLDLSKAFDDDDYSDILGPGDYNDTEAAIPTATSPTNTFDGIAIHPGLRVIIYSEKDFEGDVLLDKEGPAIINNVRWIGEPDYCVGMGNNWLQPLQSEFPQGVREWSDSDMHGNEWKYGSFKIEALYP